MSRVLDLITALRGNPTTKAATAEVTPALDDNTKNLATTEFIRDLFTKPGRRWLHPTGYQMLPGGLLIQWGKSDVPAGNSLGVDMPYPWPTGILWASGNVGTPITPGPWAIGISPRPGFPNQILIQNTDTLNHGVFWLAIGS